MSTPIKAEELASMLEQLGFAAQAAMVQGKPVPRLRGTASLQTEAELNKFIGCEPLKDEVRLWSNDDSPVLITGESGTGKELLAKALHGDRKGNFVPINCAGFIANESLMESELFGHVRGAFTGATYDNNGAFREANEGTLFLDEVGELPLNVQAKLLRVLNDGMVKPVGTHKLVKINVRLVCATHAKIEDLVKAKAFRLDLYYRIAVGRLHIPPLRERPDDLVAICRKLLHLPAEAYLPFNVKDFLPLEGNVRELQMLVKRYKILGNLGTSPAV